MSAGPDPDYFFNGSRGGVEAKLVVLIARTHAGLVRLGAA